MRHLEIRIGILILCQGLAIWGRDTALKIRDSRTGLIVSIPELWEVDKGDPNFCIVNFPPNKRPRMVLVPEDKAEICIGLLPERNKGRSYQDTWLKYRIHEFTESSPGRYSVHDAERVLLRGLGEVDVVFVRDYNEIIPNGKRLVVFFPFKGRIVIASLFYRSKMQDEEIERYFFEFLERLVPAGSR